MLLIKLANKAFPDLAMSMTSLDCASILFFPCERFLIAMLPQLSRFLEVWVLFF